MRLTIVTILALTLIVAASGSKARLKDDPFSRVPSSRRSQLKSRLHDFVGYHAAKDWDRVYGLLSDRYKTDQSITKETFLGKRLYSQLNQFTPAYAYRLSDEWWWIRGCGTFEANGGMDTLVEAHYMKGNWYFSDFSGFPYGCIECAALDCKP